MNWGEEIPTSHKKLRDKKFLPEKRKKKNNSKDHFKPHGQKNLMKDSNSKNKTKIDMQLF